MFPPDTEIVASLEGIPQRWCDHFDQVVPSLGSHAGKLNLLADTVVCRAADEDVLIFIDGDAFPIAPVAGRLDEVLAAKPLAAVIRPENGDHQPHPCFAFTTCGFWKRICGDWSSGYTWVNSLTNKLVTDVGGNLLYTMESAHEAWEQLVRTESLTDHPVFYGVYGDCIYHHGAGFREKLVRANVEHGGRGARTGPSGEP